jgi:hypothetical protein
LGAPDNRIDAESNSAGKQARTNSQLVSEVEAGEKELTPPCRPGLFDGEHRVATAVAIRSDGITVPSG